MAVHRLGDFSWIIELGICHLLCNQVLNFRLDVMERGYLSGLSETLSRRTGLSDFSSGEEIELRWMKSGV